MIAALTPSFDWNALAPIVAVASGSVFALLFGLLPGRLGRGLALIAALLGAGISVGWSIGLWDSGTARDVIAASLVIDRAALVGFVLTGTSALAAIAFAARNPATEDAGHGETYALLLAAVLGANILLASNDLVTLFLGLELLSVPLYVLAASNVERTASLEAGLKYLILGSVGSGTLLMGIALIYGATGSMQLPEIAEAAGRGSLQGLVYPGLALVIAGFGFKLSLAPLHQWTPDVYDGSPTPITAFMSVATKAAALIAVSRLLIVGLDGVRDVWEPIVLTLAAASIIVGNVGALGQPGMKRLLGYSSIAQAGYLAAALAVGAMGALLAYLAAYAVSTLAVFAVVIARETERPELGDSVDALNGLASERPLLGWVGTAGLFGLAGLPLTVGFFAKLTLASVLVSADHAWLAVLVLVGSIISLAYYAPPVLRIWRRPPAEPGAQAPAVARPELVLVGVLAALLVIAGGLYPAPLLDVAQDASSALLGSR